MVEWALTTLISSAFTALLNCAEVERRNRILTNYRFLSHSLSLLEGRLKEEYNEGVSLTSAEGGRGYGLDTESKFSGFRD